MCYEDLVHDVLALALYLLAGSIASPISSRQYGEVPLVRRLEYTVE